MYDIIGLVYLAAIHTKSQSKLTQSVNNKIVNSDVFFGLSCCLSIQTVQAIQTAGSCQEKLATSFDSVFLCCMFYIAVETLFENLIKGKENAEHERSHTKGVAWNGRVSLPVSLLRGKKMEMVTVTIDVDWRCLESIKQAEKDKAALENKGYTLVNSFGGVHVSSLIYKKLEQGERT